VAGLWFGLGGPKRARPAPLVEVVITDPDPTRAEWCARQRLFDQKHPPRPVRHFEDSTLLWERLNLAAVLRIRPHLASGAGVVFDEFSHFRRSPNLRFETPFPEHPDGSWWVVTNAQGLRMDRPSRGDGLEFVVLATGDSHSEGACNNAESWSQLLGARLDTLGLAGNTDVLNASCGGFTLYSYLGVLERALAGAQGLPKPNVYAVAIYGGNDLLELLPFRHYFARRPRPLGHSEYTVDMQHLRRDYMPAMAQVFEQILYFRHNPGEQEEAIAGAVEVLVEIDRLCQANGIRFVPMWLPSAADLEWDRHGDVFDVIAADRTLEDHWRHSALRLGERIRAETAQLDWIDLGPPLAEVPGGAFWVLDNHINLAAHESIAQQLFARLSERGWLPTPGSAAPEGSAGSGSGR